MKTKDKQEEAIRKQLRQDKYPHEMLYTVDFGSFQITTNREGIIDFELELLKSLADEIK